MDWRRIVLGVGLWLYSVTLGANGMNDELKDIVKQARLPACHLSHPVALKRFAELVRQDERKSCANILDAFAEDMENKEWTLGAAAMRGAADTIRFKQTNDETEGQK
jgi:hypothetical protein